MVIQLRLSTLDWSHNKISDSGARGIAKLLSSPIAQITTLKLNNNQISKEGVKSIGRALQTNHCLQSLDVRLNHLLDAGGHALLVSLFKNTSLQFLDLSGNGLEMKSVQALSALLKMNITSLTRLDLSCNKLGDYSGEKNSASTSNLLGLAKLSDVAGKTIFEAISQNKVPRILA